MSMPGLPELMVLFLVVILLFGGKKLPELGGAIGESIRNFRKGIKDAESGGQQSQPPQIANANTKAAAPDDKNPV